jgi:hypothetical protein
LVIVLALVTSSGCSFVFRESEEAGVLKCPEGWTKRAKLVFNNGFAGASDLEEDLVDFPVLVVISPAAIADLGLQPDGRDLRFSGDDGPSILAHEIEVVSEGDNGTLFVWVKVPLIEAGSATDSIWLFGGNGDAVDAQRREEVWDNGYVAVWHLNRLVGGLFEDSTSSQNNAGLLSGQAAADVLDRGQVGNGLSLDGATEIEANDSTSLDLIEDLTLEAWVANTSSVPNNDNHAVSKSSAYDIRLFRESGAAAPKVHIFVDAENSAEAEAFSQLGTPFSYLAGSRDFETGVTNFFLDGTLHESVTEFANMQIVQNDRAVKLGEELVGQLDEVRISNVARSQAWIAAQHRSMMQEFIVTGDIEVCP